MSAPITRPVLAPAAAAELVRALMSPASYPWWKDLRDVTAEEWDGPDTGLPYRTYRGALPSYLPLEIITWRDQVPDLLSPGGGS